VAYHETFWAVAGAAAPVIALAAVIQLGDISRGIVHARGRLADWYEAQGITKAERMQGTPRERHQREKHLRPVLYPFLIGAYLNLGGQAVVLAWSLNSLRHHADAPLTFASYSLQFGLYALAFISVGVVTVRMRWTRKMDQATREVPDATNRNDSGEPTSPRNPRAD